MTDAPSTTSHANHGAIKGVPELRRFINSIQGRGAREEFAKRCGTSLAHLINIMYGAGKRCKRSAPKLSVLIERHSNGAVTRFNLHRADWHEIWPELVGTPGAPAVPALAEEVAA